MPRMSRLSYALLSRPLFTQTGLKLEAALIKDRIYSALIGTTQAIDLVQGGVKANALPEEAWAVVNHRVPTQRSVFYIHTMSSRCSFILPTHGLRAALLGLCSNAIQTS